VKGSGPYGRVVKADVEAAAKGGVKAAPAAAAPAAAAPVAKAAPAPAVANPFEPAYEEIPNSSMRKVIAKRLTEAKQTVPHFYLTIDCEVDALLKTRAELNGRSDAYKLSVNDFVIRAVALALKKVPAANASWGEEAIKRYTDVDISVAVATPNGLITPIVRHADHKGLAAISNEMKELAGKAKDGKLKPEEFQGGGFTISNLGMYGIKEFAAIINPPQGCILAVGAGEQRPVVKNGALAVATVMSCTLSVDHRVVDGAVGAEFLAAFKKLIEDPLSMLL
jgi:pyruvate dehydrogenase E2 component (dihydrolipoamide acetyltransferase)